MKTKRLLTLLPVLAMLTALLCGCGQKNPAGTEEAAGTQVYNSVEELESKRFGVLTGTIFDQVVQENVPDSQIVYYNATADLPEALERGKIDAYATDEPLARILTAKSADQQILTKLVDDQYGFIFPKDAEHETYIGQINEFLAECREDGTLEELDSIWFGTDASVQTVDISDLTGENGTLNFFVSTAAGEPFVYMKDGVLVGYEIDVAAHFCREYGYGLSVNNTDFSGVLAAVSGGKADMGAASISITEERKQVMGFSDPHYIGGVVVVGKGAAAPAQDTAIKHIGVLTGTIFDALAEKYDPSATVEYFNTEPDLPAALKAGKIDAYIVDEPIFRMYSHDYTEQYVMQMLEEYDYAYILPKDSEKHEALCAQMDEFLAKCWEDGTVDELCEKWLDGDVTGDHVDFSGLTGENGTISFATSTSDGAIFDMITDGEFGGYEIELFVRFCREYGYKPEITDYSFAGLIAAVTAGKADIGGCTITITDERRESMLFTEPNYHGGAVLVGTAAAQSADAAADDTDSARSGIAESFEKTFIREDRWKLFTGGIGLTLLITALSTLFGTVLGFGIFMIYRKECRIFNAVINVLMDILQKTPVVVILMILYYIVFGKSDLSGAWVSVVGFSVMFACSFVGTLKVGVMAVDKGQTEASLALGFTDTRSFLRVILPQAAKHFLPNYKGQIVSLLKDTAVVGYIAVQDLTKVGDIVRSRTYEAFFPLVATAVIYFLLAWVLTLLVQRFEFRTDPTRRSREKILKGVKTK